MSVSQTLIEMGKESLDEGRTFFETLGSTYDANSHYRPQGRIDFRRIYVRKSAHQVGLDLNRSSS